MANAPTGAVPPLAGLRVVDLSSWIAGGYCTKLFADGGADVVKVELPEGDPLRRWSASGADIGEGADGALFNYLHASQRSVVVQPDGDLGAMHELLAAADIAVWSRGPRPGRRSLLSPAELAQAHPHLIVGAISPFGLDGPWDDKPATEFTLQAWSGGALRIGRSRPERAPTYVAGQVGEWMAGLYAAIGTLAAWRAGSCGVVDVSMLEVLAATLTYYPVTFHDQLGRPMQRDRFVPIPGVSPARDGMVGLGTGTGQQWLDFCAMVEHPEWAQEHAHFMNRAELAPKIAAWTSERTVAEILDLATAFRLPNAPIVNGADMAAVEHMRVRDTFVRNPRDGALNPRPACRFENVPLRVATPAPALGQHTGATFLPAADRAVQPSRASGAAALPFAGLRVLDMTAFWAGPLTGHLLALLGAEVVHLEAMKRPDGVRFVGGVPQTEEHYLERSPIFAALNTNKKSLAIDTRSQAGVDLLKRYLATCDVVVENYTPRVLDQLGLDADTLRAINPGLITVRMPGFGLDGPWREVAAFAFVIEDASGFTWLTGHPDAPPIEPYCIGDPNAGLHALFGLQLALAHRERTGEGGLVEAAMLDAALNVTAEQLIEHSAYGALLMRDGNRGPLAAPQGVYQAAGPDEYGGDDSWVAIAVTTDEQWLALAAAIGEPAWATDPALAGAAGRRERHDEIDALLSAWCRRRPAAEIVDVLWPAGVPVAPVAQPHRQADLPPLQERGFFESLDHPVIGGSRYATLPMTLPQSPDRWHHRHAPLLGEHTMELLAALGLTPEELAVLAADGVIGEHLRQRDAPTAL
jgi:crotonobetainyl-CoA:carnitine CoA-transferase CaiB-like acyl-CoA transferase